ncbi:MAG: 1-acyl-sn-glycerol-3-phosphate acyltransferase [Clostridia bacterium]|nr:1-acyl-sn-glycerol-3-phosphate acyltransferase [Clostridia bacterium]
MANEESLEKESRLYRVGRVLTAVLFHSLMPVRYHGAEKIRDREAPFVLIANHVHALDPLVVAFPAKKEQCVFLAKKELAKNAFIERLLKNLHCILVDRHNTDMEAMRACMRVLKAGKILVIFPEGTRHHEGQMEQIENGTSLIVMRGKAPVVPVYIQKPLRLFRTTHAWVGDPIPYDDLLAEGINVDTCGRLNDRMRDTFRRMIRESGRDPTGAPVGRLQD